MASKEDNGTRLLMPLMVIVSLCCKPSLVSNFTPDEAGQHYTELLRKDSTGAYDYPK